jgi:hypothetical protein
VVNEPNGQLWPQRSPAADPAQPFEVDGSELTIHHAVGEMMVTVDQLATATSGLTCLGPSTSDAVGDPPRMVAGVLEGFTDALLDELDRRRFGGGCHWIWSYHNYVDMEQGASGVADLRAQIEPRWRGLRRDDGPVIAATEGGVRLDELGDGLSDGERLREQADRLARAVDRHRDPTDLGAGLAFLTQYTVTADPKYDCGLLEPDGTERLAFAAWHSALA